ncbi:hypothetical protein QJQ45_027102 [Haematococcus lacustris]|nr:hypothetical protein QJQ45_027102 [Haematococcus lacustris]
MDAHWHHGDGNNGPSDSSTALLTIASTIAVALMASAVMLIYALQAWVAALGAMVTMMYMPFMLITEAIMSVLWFPFATTSAITSMAAPVGTALFGAPFLLLEQTVAAGISPLMRALHLAPCPADAASMQHMQQQQEQEHQQRTAQVARTLAAGLYGMLLAVVAQEVWRWWKKRGVGNVVPYKSPSTITIQSSHLPLPSLPAWSLTQFKTVTKHHLQHLAAASSAGTSLEANLKHITVTLATWDAVWEVYLDPKWARQRLRLYGAQDRALEQFFNKLEEEMAELSLKRHDHAKQLVVFFGAATIGTGGGWGADAVLRACRKVVCRPRGPDQLRGRVVLVDEHRTSRVSSAVNGQQPCEVELNTLSATRPAGWKPPAGQVEPRLVRPAWSQERGQPVRGLVWCPVVPPRKPPQAPRSSQAATQPAASEPGPSTPPPAKRSKPAAEPTKGKGKGKAAKAKPAPQPGRWLDRDCNAALNMQRIGESRWRPLELCYWPDQGALPAKGKEYPGLGYKRLQDKPPKPQEHQQQPAEAQLGWKVYLDPKWARQRLRLYGAKDRALEQFFKKLEEEMAQVSMQRHGHGKQLVVFFGAAGIGIGGGSTVNGQQPCKEQLDHEQPTRPADWKPPAGQVDLRLLRPAWSQQRDQPVRGMMWCPVVAPCKPPQAPCSSQAATQAAASGPGPSKPPPAKRTKAKQAAEPTQPTKGKGKAQGKAAKAKPAPQPGRWLDRDCNAALNMQPIGESRWRPLELYWWPDHTALLAKGREYPGLGYKRVRDKAPKAQQQRHQPAGAQ